MLTPPRRRWLRFSLRTMFVVVTALAAFLAYHVNWIRERRATQAQTNWYRIYDSGLDYLLDKPPPRAPGLLWVFGETGRHELYLSFGYEPTEHFTYSNRDLTPVEQSEVRRIESLFPEARIDAQAYIEIQSWGESPD